MEASKALTIRSRTFLGGIVVGTILGFVFEQSFRSLIIGGIFGGIYLGAMGEGIVGGNAWDGIGAGLFLGLIAGIVVAVTIRPFTFFSIAQPFIWGVIGIFSGLLGHLVGRIMRVIWYDRNEKS